MRGPRLEPAQGADLDSVVVIAATAGSLHAYDPGTPTHATFAGDTGSPEVQIALLTHRIADITAHLKEHQLDHASRRGLQMLNGRRRRLLNYLQKNDVDRYRNLIRRLGLRK